MTNLESFNSGEHTNQFRREHRTPQAKERMMPWPRVSMAIERALNNARIRAAFSSEEQRIEHEVEAVTNMAWNEYVTGQTTQAEK